MFILAILLLSATGADRLGGPTSLIPPTPLLACLEYGGYERTQNRQWLIPLSREKPYTDVPSRLRQRGMYNRSPMSILGPAGKSLGFRLLNPCPPASRPKPMRGQKVIYNKSYNFATTSYSVYFVVNTLLVGVL
jgi:hypothetical protein